MAMAVARGRCVPTAAAKQQHTVVRSLSRSFDGDEGDDEACSAAASINDLASSGLKRTKGRVSVPVLLSRR